MKILGNRFCEYCDKEFELKSSWKTQRFCSRSCSAKRRTGTNSPRYKDGTQACEYKQMSNNGKVMLIHRYIMEQHLGRELRSDEHVHHKDGNKHNNEISNLELVPIYTHSSYHVKNYRDDIHKQCGKCGHIKPRWMFGILSKQCGDPSPSWCKLCFRLYDKIKRHIVRLNNEPKL